MTPAGPGAPIAAIEQMPLAAAMRESLWLYPAVEIAHISGFVVLVGSIAMFDMRLLGASRALSVRGLARHLLPWSLGALIIIVPTGLMMFIAHASDFLSNPAFQLKMLLLMCAGMNAAVFHAGVFRGVTQWDSGVATPGGAKAHAAVSLTLWFSIIGCGRMLAYL